MGNSSCSNCGKDHSESLKDLEETKEIIERFGKQEEVTIWWKQKKQYWYWCKGSNSYYCNTCFWKPIDEEKELLSGSDPANEYVEFVCGKKQRLLVEPYCNPSIGGKEYSSQVDTSEASDTDEDSNFKRSADDESEGTASENDEQSAHVQDDTPKSKLPVTHVSQPETDTKQATMEEDDIPQPKMFGQKVAQGLKEMTSSSVQGVKGLMSQFKKRINLGKLPKDDPSDDEEQKSPQDSDSKPHQVEGPAGDYQSVDELIDGVLQLKPDFRHISMDREVLRVIQSSLMLHFSKDNNISDAELDVLLDALSSIASPLCCVDYFKLTQSLATSIRKCRYMHLDRSEEDRILELFLQWLLCNGADGPPNSPWVSRCLSTLLFEIGVHDGELVDMMVLLVATSLWSTEEVLTLHDDLKKAYHMPHNVTMHLFYIIQKFQVPYKVVKSTLSPYKRIPVITSEMYHELEFHTKQTEEESVKKMMLELSAANGTLINGDMLEQIEKIIAKKYSFSLQSQFSQEYQTTIEEAKQAMARMAKNPTMTTKDAILIVSGLVCAIKNIHPLLSCSRVTTMSVTLFMLMHKQGLSCFLDHFIAGTDIDKSCIIAMVATVLGVQKKKVDIFTKSVQSARENCKKWKALYKAFELRVSCNTDTKDLMKLSAKKADEKRKDTYECDIVYGTVTSFSADLLRQEFEMRKVRGKRGYSIAIVDTAEKFLLDEGAQSVSLFQRKPELQHIEPVLAMTWSAVKHFTPFCTTNGEVLFAGIPKYFHVAICERMGSSEFQPQQFLQLAADMELMLQRTVQVCLDATSADEKKKALEEFGTEKMVAYFSKLNDYIPLNIVVYTLIGSNTLEVAMASAAHSETKVNVALLILDQGKVSPLYTQAELTPAIEKMVLSHIKIAKHDEPYHSKPKKLIIPFFLSMFVTGQLPEYINSALTALTLTENKEYSIDNGRIVLMDFESSDNQEESIQWGSGLQQMLELKHQLQLSPIHMVTNYISHAELFQKYASEGCLYGVLDTPTSKLEEEVLKAEYGINVCKVPSDSHIVQCEREPIFVEDRNMWLERINHIVSDEIRAKCFARLPTSTVLVLCEDVQAANDIFGYLTQNGPTEISLQLHNGNQKEVSDNIKVVVSTSCTQSRQTQREVLCLVTFLPRNKRDVHRAFEYVTQSGWGSVQFVLPVSALPEDFQGLDINTMRQLMEEEEVSRLTTTVKHVKELKSKTMLFKEQCKYLCRTDDLINRKQYLTIFQPVILDILNEQWGVWLLGYNRDRAPEENLKHLQEYQSQWIAKGSMSPRSIPSSNFYHCTKIGNLLVRANKFHKALQFYDFAIATENNFSMLAYYSRAYCIIRCKDDNYIDRSCNDLRLVQGRIQKYIEQASVMLQCATVGEQSSESDFAKQMKARMHVLQALDKRVDKDLEVLKKSKKNGDEVEAIPSNTFQLIHLADSVTREELSYLKELGLDFLFTIKEHPHFHFCWQGLLVCLLGVAELVGGVLLTAFTVGAASEIGLALIAEGVSDCMDGVIGMWTGEWSWTQWAIGKACSIAVSLATGGIGKFLEEGAVIAKDVAQIPKVIKESAGEAALENLKNSGKLVGKEFVEQGALRILNEFENEVLQKIAQEIAETVTKKVGISHSLHSSFEGSNKLGQIVNCKFASRIPASFVKVGKMPSVLHQQALDFFTEVVHQVVGSLLSDSSPYFDQIMSSLSMLIHDISGHLEGKASLLHVFELPLVGVAVGKTAGELEKVFIHFQPKIIEYSEREGQKGSVQTLRESLCEIAASTLSESEVTAIKEKQEDDITDSFIANLTKDINERLHKSCSRENDPFQKVIDTLFIARLPNGESQQQIKDEAKAFFEAAAKKITDDTSKYFKMVATTSEIVPSASRSISTHQQDLEEHLMEEMDQYCSEQFEKVAVAHTRISALHAHLETLDLHKRVEQHTADFFQGSGEQADETKIYNLECVAHLKNQLAKNTTHAFHDAIASILLQNLSWLANNFLNRTVNKTASHCIKKGLRVERTLEDITAHQKANALRSKCLSEVEASVGGLADLESHAKSVLYSKQPGSLAELRALTELHGCKVTILNSNGMRKCSLRPDSTPGKETTPEITLIHYSKEEHPPDGHYDVVVNGKRVKVESEDNDCMYEAVAHGLTAAKAKAGESEETYSATSLREGVAKEISENPGKWVEHFAAKEELHQLRKGELYLLEGAGKFEPKKLEIKLVEGCGKTTIHTLGLHNGVNGHATVTHTCMLTIAKKPSRRGQSNIVGKRVQKISLETGGHWQVKKMVTVLNGLNRLKNFGIRSYTGASLGQLQHPEGTRDGFSAPCSGHIIGSRHGAPAGVVTGNSVVMSEHLNRKEDELWRPNSDLTKFVGDSDFTCEAVTTLEPLIPHPGGKEGMKVFIRRFNADRAVQNIKREREWQNENRERAKQGLPPHPKPDNLPLLDEKLHLPGLLRRFEEVSKKAPKLRRVGKISYIITKQGEQRKFSLGPDLALYVHAKFFAPSYKKGTWQFDNDISNAKPKSGASTYLVDAKYQE